MEIQINNWFTKAGQPLKGDNLMLQQVKNAAECARQSNTLKWENLMLYGGNNLASYLNNHYKESSKEWNTIAVAAKEHFNSELKDFVSTQLKALQLSDDVLLSVEDVFISFYIEKAFRDRIPGLPFDQFETLMAILNDGHIPCGWNGPMPRNEGEDPIDYSKGKILVW